MHEVGVQLLLSNKQRMRDIKVLEKAWLAEASKLEVNQIAAIISRVLVLRRYDAVDCLFRKCDYTLANCLCQAVPETARH